MGHVSSFVWAGDGLVSHDLGTDGPVRVTESFLLHEGAVLALDAHRDRFVASVAISAPERVDQATAFWEAAIGALPREGRWFPRLSLVESAGDPEPFFRLSVRPSPELKSSLRLTTASHDPRQMPTVKGPDLERLSVLRDEAAAAGADEAVILSADGTVVEGNYTSLVWWRGGALCTVADELPRLPGVTEKALVTLATALGVEVLPDEVMPDELDGLEVWALNSLQGIRIATTWLDGPSLAEEPGRLRLWRARLERLRRPLP